MPQRYDRATRMTKVDATPQGGLAVRANLTRTGVLTYTRADGTTSRELRHPDDVFDPASLATLRGAPLTIGHPGMVTPSSYKKDTVGHVGDDVQPDAPYVGATVRVQDAGAVEGVRAGELVELSPGYSVTLVEGAGTYNGEHYDARHTNIRYNHLALLAPGKGRSGAQVALKLDAAELGQDVAYEAEGYERYDSSVTPEQLLAALEAATKRADAAEAKIKAQDSAELEALRGANKVLSAENAQLKADAAKVKTDAADVTTPANLDKLVAERTDTIAKAKVLAGDKYDSAGKSNVAIMRESIAVAYPDLKFESDGEVKGAFISLAATRAGSQSARKVAASGGHDPNGTREDADDSDPLAAAQTAMNTRKFSTPAAS